MLNSNVASPPVTTEESSSTLIHRLHTNERQLRTLAVVLSLAGGLALSFALGVGIMIYWYSRKCKRAKRLYNINSDDEEDEEEDDDDEKSCATNASYCSECHHQFERERERERERELLRSIPSAPQFIHGSLPEPSAPSAKEIVADQLCHDCLIPPPAYSKD